MPPELELGIDQLLVRDELQLLEAKCLVLRECLVRDVGERRASPQLERLAQHRRTVFELRFARLAESPLEDRSIELLGADAEHVAGRPRDQRIPEPTPQLGNGVVQGGVGGLRRGACPQLVDQALGRYDLVRPHQQGREECPLALPVSSSGRPSALTSSGPRIRNSSIDSL